MGVGKVGGGTTMLMEGFFFRTAMLWMQKAALKSF